MKLSEERLTNETADQMLFSSIQKEPFKGFKDSFCKSKLKSYEKTKELTFQRNSLRILVACSNEYQMRVDLEKVVSYPLAPVPIPLGTPDGAIRKTVIH